MNAEGSMRAPMRASSRLARQGGVAMGLSCFLVSGKFRRKSVCLPRTTVTCLCCKNLSH